MPPSGFTVMLESIASVSLLTLMEIVAPVLLGSALVYAIMRLRTPQPGGAGSYR